MGERGRKTIAALCCIRRQTYLHAPRPLQSLPPLPLPTAITRSYVSSDLSKLEIDVGGVAEEGGEKGSWLHVAPPPPPDDANNRTGQTNDAHEVFDVMANRMHVG